jgi:hypothetical protein
MASHDILLSPHCSPYDTQMTFSCLIDKEEADRLQEQNFTAYTRIQSTSVGNIDESYRYQW